ncbi:adenosylcobinamide-GDP ribazoletransferase [Ureibacillus thermophilus]|uniref:Adenosylcobinamide-GDP ribazoletransferase n=1 Tax=Ureibacillus thermophilus TaxID=367743 RepID=A0A4P6UUP5_9BACL|nr:adenosylcobinamide-GDP ribazoletransferase [Ureibacillus thermophilus]QBK25921.1 adenosylcobinamide-GDP ribazoletransferase [Ureibacillus thermophilus]
MKNLVTGFLLALQFFTSFPIRKTLPMTNKSVTAMFGAMPFVSLLMGLIIVFVLTVNNYYFEFSPLFLAILVVVLNIVMTGGLHLDGWIDLGDAYFSYRDRQRRLEILSDSRVGAFGAIALVILLLLKIGIFYDMFLKRPSNLYYYFLFVPVLCRMAMLIYFNLSVNVKESGLASFFKNQVMPKRLWIFIECYLVFIIIAAYLLKDIFLVVLLFSMFIVTLLYRKWTYVHFGGMTGDLLGALYEGMELVLWGVLLLLFI